MLKNGGIVKDIKTREKAKEKVLNFAREQGFEVVSVIESPIKGGDGNVEYLAHFRKSVKNEKHSDNTKSE